MKRYHANTCLSIVPDEPPNEVRELSTLQYLGLRMRYASDETLTFIRKATSDSILGSIIFGSVPLIGLGLFLYYSQGWRAFIAWATATSLTISMLVVFVILLWLLSFLKSPLGIHRRALGEIASLRRELSTLTADQQRNLTLRPRLMAKDFRAETRIWQYPVREGSKIEGYRQHYDSCLLLTIENDPISHAESCVVMQAAGTLEFQHEGGETKRFPARWIVVGAPADRPPSRFDHVADFGIGTCREVLIAFKRQGGDPRCYAVTDAGIHNASENQSLADYAGGMPPGKTTVTLRLRAIAVDLAWRLEFTNPEETTRGGWELSADGITPVGAA